jgi:hypothetical protein
MIEKEGRKGTGVIENKFKHKKLHISPQKTSSF